SAPANGHDIISVASAENTELQANYFEVDELSEGEEPAQVPWLGMSGADAPPSDGESEELAWIGSACAPDPVYDGDEEELLSDPEGKVALIKRGGCQFDTKYERAEEAGATGVVIYNNTPGLFAGTVGDAGVEDVWSVGIGQADGEALVEELEDDVEVTLGFTDEVISAPNPNGGLVSSFSSYGQDVELGFGPSVMAPGGLITSTYPLATGGYAMLSGTSMAAPHVAGAVALLLEDEPDLDPIEVRDRLQNTAEPAPWSLAPESGLLDHSFRQGAGLIQIDQAIDAEHAVSPGQLAAGDGAEPVERTIRVSNDTNEPVEYDLGFTPALETGWDTYLLGGGFFLAGAEAEFGVTFEHDSVTVAGGSTAEVEATIMPPSVGLPNHQYGGYITMTPDTDELPTLRVPYSGFAGDYQSMPLLGAIQPDGTIDEVDPVLSEIADVDEQGAPITEPVDEGHEFTVRDGDYPVIDAFFGHYPQRMEVYAVQQPSGRERLVMSQEYLPRSPQPGEFLPFPWDGTTASGQSDNTRPVPSGTYTLEVNVLRALGDPDNEDHWETWESPEFELDSRRGGPGSGEGPRGPGSGPDSGPRGNGR
ncbi:MAG: S8 family serine peptidase, partial [Nitriliruptoraceae bacterium]